MLNRRTATVFLSLVLLHAAHFSEEFCFRLYDVLPLARFVSGIVPDNPPAGFALANAIFVSFGLACYAFPVRRAWSARTGLIWFWIVIETINGSFHLLWMLAARAYRPGGFTAPIVLLVAVWLACRRLRDAAASAPGVSTTSFTPS